jgi:hypothetical protein
VTEEISVEIKQFLESKENENKTYKNLWDAAKAVVSGKFIGISAYIKKKTDCPNKQLMMDLKHLEKQ